MHKDFSYKDFPMADFMFILKIVLAVLKSYIKDLQGVFKHMC